MTFSIAGRCARTGMVGTAVTTSSIAVGSRCHYVMAGIGAALTQHRTDPRLGPMMLSLLKSGFTAQQAVNAAVAATPGNEWRQLGLIGCDGRTAFYCGASVKPERAEVPGRNCVALGNIVRSTQVPQAMVLAFEGDADAPLATRLIAALAAGEAAGGEFKPVISAALLVADRESFPYVDLRVDSDPDPIRTLARLWNEYEPVAKFYSSRATEPETPRTV
jgi:uncharacterized Ntn-hydrolase superfamily protein